MSRPMMKCGHAANATQQGKPVCAICVGIKPGATEVDPETPDLTDRTARCAYGPHKDVPSSVNLAFFSHTPDKPFDSYYCGCYGWD